MAKRIFAVAICLLALMSVTLHSYAQNANPGVIPPKASPYGHTYGEWSARWWQWAYSIPVPVSPLFDETGAAAGSGQSGPVWFLAGVFNVSGAAERTVTVPHGKALFIPMLNAEWDNLCPPNDPPLGTDALRALVIGAIDTVTDMRCEIDGVSQGDLGTALTSPYRATSPVFTVTFPEDNVFQAFGCDVAPGAYGPFVADGVYLMVAPLRAGNHTIHFTASAYGGGFVLDITYHLTVGK